MKWPLCWRSTLEKSRRDAAKNYLAFLDQVERATDARVRYEFEGHKVAALKHDLLRERNERRRLAGELCLAAEELARLDRATRADDGSRLCRVSQAEFLEVLVMLRAVSDHFENTDSPLGLRARELRERFRK